MAANHQGHDAAEDASAVSGFDTAQWKAYEKRWSRELPGNPTNAFIGIALALALFLFMAVMPGLMDWMQEEGIIKPRIHLRPIMGVQIPEKPDPEYDKAHPEQVQTQLQQPSLDLQQLFQSQPQGQQAQPEVEQPQPEMEQPQAEPEPPPADSTHSGSPFGGPRQD